MPYNIIRNASFQTLTSSGTGNKSLNWAELESLIDGTTTSGGITITSGDVLWLSVDLSQRIKLDSIRLYSDDLPKSDNITFFVKDDESDSYSQLTTNVSDYYYPTLVEPKAPRFILTTISGVDMTIHEYEAVNDSYIVAFGADGSSYAEYLENTPVGEEGTAQAIELFNNGTSAMAADAYTVVDHTGNVADEYIKISSSQNGTYYGIDGGALMEDDLVNSTYRWSMGSFDGTEVSTDKVILSNTALAQLMGRLPLVGASEAFNAGNDTWDWDRINKKMYAIGRDGSMLKLWEYLYGTDEWDYIAELDSATSDEEDNVPVMSYCDGYIYCMYKVDGSFGRHELGGSADNWTSLSGAVWDSAWSPTPSQDRVAMCSDGTRYVYVATVDLNQSTANRNFKRYDTVSSIWDSMDAGYQQYPQVGGGGQNQVSIGLTYDYDRERVYMVCGSEWWSDNGSYVQKYDINTDGWAATWLRLDTVNSNFNYIHYSLSYHNNYIYLGPGYQVGTTCYRYGLSTGIFESYSLGYRHQQESDDSPGFCIIAIDAPQGSPFESSVYFAQISGNREYLVGYNPALSTAGTYTSPIFKLDDKYNSSYFSVDGTAVSGTGSISYDENVYNGTIRVRSSDTEPVHMYDAYTIRRQNQYMYVEKYIPYTDSYTSWIYSDWGADRYYFTSSAVDRRTGYVAITHYYNYSANPAEGRVYIYNRSGGLVTSASWGSTMNYIGSTALEFDKNGGLWSYSNWSYWGGRDTSITLLHINSTMTTLASIYDGTDFLYDFAVELDGDGVWYTDKISDLLIHKNTSGTTMQSFALDTPRAVCGTLDNGCWVVDNGTGKARRYGYTGTLITSVSLPETAALGTTEAARMTTDYADGFWYRNGYYFYHANSAGSVDIGPININNADRLKSTYNGCFVISTANDMLYFIDKSAGAITKSTSTNSNAGSVFGALPFDIDSFIEFQETANILPLSYDPVWGTGGSAEWQEVRKDGYFVPKDQYHQVEVTLRGDATLEKILMPPAVRTEDIQAQQSKSIYIKTDIPTGASISDYSSRLRTWRGV